MSETIDYHNLGTFATLEEVYKLYSNGGSPGDYVTIAGVVTYWNDPQRIWGNASPLPSVGETTYVNGNLSVGGDLSVSGKIINIDAPVTMDISFSKGSFLAPGEIGTVIIKIWKGLYYEITNTMLRWEWTRDSGDPSADATWKIDHAGYTDSGDISYEDLGNNSLTSVSTLFHFWCSDQAGTTSEGTITI